MPLRSGSLTSLAKSPPPNIDYEQLCFMALGQMLSALDYLASENLIHRDVKPDNVLYFLLNGRYVFQLADFGLAHHRSLITTFCGTGYYQAPELWPSISGVNAGQSPKLDIWSLLACIVAVCSRMEEFPPDTTDYGIVLGVLNTKIPAVSRLEPIARLHPDRRVSAAQMLVLLFYGEGLIIPKSKIPPIEPDVPAAEPNSRLRTRNDRGKAP
jgi:serine/threonine protein kinase